MLKDVARGLVIILSMLAVVLAGCARRPGMARFSSPAPTGAAVSMGQGSETVAAATGTQAGTPGVGSSEAETPGAGSAAPGSAGAGSVDAGSAAASPATSSAKAVTAPAERPSPRDFEANPNLQTIHFEFDKSDIRPGEAKILDANARWLTDNPTHLVLVEGHCDERGTDEYNLALGERRAVATRNYLVSQGVQATRITTLSYGEERPLCTGHDEGCWSQNRRAQFLTKTGP